MSTALPIMMPPDLAREITDRIKVGAEAVWQLVVEAYEQAAWAALGYQSWDEYCAHEFGTTRLRLPREERSDVVGSLRQSGLSVRAIASATGVGLGTVHREITGVPNGTADFCPNCRHAEHNGFCDQQCPECGDGDALAEDLIVAEPRPITGLDGKTYNPKSAPRQPRRKPITEAFDAASYDLRRTVERVVRLTQDDRFTKQKDQITGCNLSDLVRTRDALNGVIQQLKG